ncbi:hypothetical protein N7495_000998 [Penicillium taxi]|uniref:uncharacterized protein n=1 Tax=Penicillium taxi TaxID=168475 RepID=UPI002544D69C|nr:uncharacterized protein N7495_000998 [Penicillium taxi]KAJ5908316.1 hypothetical protein N7495_000998 [Penicillium taxi]
MFSSSKTQDRLRRSMSTRSMRRSRPVSDTDRFDPELAKAQATAAASRAMRPSGRSSNESSNAYDRLGGPLLVAVPRLRPNSSLRYAGDRISLPASATRPVTPCPFSGAHGTTCAPDGEDPAILRPINEFGGLDGRDSSLPSSYRRLRKAKSMFSTRQRLSYFTHGAPSIPKRGSCDPDSSAFELPRTLRHSDSVSYIRGISQSSREVRPAKSQDAIQLAREKFFKESRSAGIQPRRSSFFSSRHGKEHKPFRKSFRLSSGSGIGASPEQINMKLSRERARTISATIKHGLRRVFGFSKTAEQRAMSRSESNASESSVVVTAYMGGKTSGANVIENTTDSSSLRASMQHSPSRGSICTSNSRVTSWADSTVANTVTTRNTGRPISSSFANDLPQLSSHHSTTCQSSSHMRGSSRKLDGSNYSQDLYAALVQQMERDTRDDPEQEIVLGNVSEHRVPARTSSVYSHHSKRTVCNAPSIVSVSPRSFATARGDSLSPQKHNLRTIRPIPPTLISRYGPSQEKSRPSSYLNKGIATSPYTIGEESDEDIESAILSRFGPPVKRSFSPSSTYSRSSGHLAIAEDSDCATLCGSEAEEPGTATIFASERTVYGSPTRLTGPVPPRAYFQPSADWKQWMNTQVGRIDRTSPVTGHFREDAQFEDDNESLTNMLRQVPVPNTDFTDLSKKINSHEYVNMQPLVDRKPSLQSNFSRPFSRSSSVRTIKPGPNGELDYTCKGSSSITTSTNENGPPRIGQVPVPMLSPMRMRSHNSPEMLESPTPSPRYTGPVCELQKPKWSQEQSQRNSIRRPIATGRAGQFRSVRSHRDSRGLNNENKRQQEEHDDIMSEYYKLHELRPTFSSKRMVDMFLDSRRHPDGTVSGSKDDVFL